MAQEAFVRSSEDVVDQFNVVMQEGQESHLLASLSDRLLPPPRFLTLIRTLDEYFDCRNGNRDRVT